MNSKINEAIELRNKERFDEAIDLLTKLSKEHPKSPDIEYQIGWTYDASDRSHLSIPHYRRALELGLIEDKVGCYVALGSSLRAVGKYEESAQVLRNGIEEFPDHLPLQVFMAMTQYNLGNHKEACTSLLQLLATTTNDEEVSSYQNAYLAYAKDLDQKW